MTMIKDGKMTTPESTQLCILYDPKSGRIVHTHQVVTYPGGRKLSEKEVESRALELGAKMGWESSKVKALHVPYEHYNPSKIFRVDLKSKRLIENPIPKGLGSRWKEAPKRKK